MATSRAMAHKMAPKASPTTIHHRRAVLDTLEVQTGLITQVMTLTPTRVFTPPQGGFLHHHLQLSHNHRPLLRTMKSHPGMALGSSIYCIYSHTHMYKRMVLLNPCTFYHHFVFVPLMETFIFLKKSMNV